MSQAKPEEDSGVKAFRLGFLSWFTFAWVVRYIRYYANVSMKHVLPLISLHKREMSANSRIMLEERWKEEMKQAEQEKRYVE